MDKTLVVTLGAVAVITVAVGSWAAYSHLSPDSGLNKWRGACRSKQGIPIEPYKSDRICIKATAIVVVPR